MPSPSALVYTIDQAAAALQVSQASVYAAVARKDLPSFRLGRRVLIPRAGLEQLLAPDRASDSSVNGPDRIRARSTDCMAPGRGESD
jgi:excisionase family DNA binding protein